MGHKVIAMDDLSGGFPENVPAKCRFVKGRVENKALVTRLFKQHKFDYVFHLAAYAAEGLSHFIKVFNYNNNLIGSINLINAAVNAGTVKCFVFTSSIAVYGRNQLPMTEELTPQPEDPYGIAKYAVELDLKEAHEMFGLNYVVFRPHNVYGERQNLSDPYRNVIGIFMNKIRNGQPMTVFGDGKQTRAFSYISDVAPVIARSIERPAALNQVFNVGADQPHAVIDLAHSVAKCMGVEPNVVHLDARNEVVNAYSSHEKAARVFGDLIKNVSLDDGLSRMSHWARTAKLRKMKAFEGIEVFKNLPPSWAKLGKKK
jgi:UDP-glucose 4-epimerase